MRSWLKQMRINSGLAQLEVANKLDISESYYCMIETGERMPKMTIEMANKLAKIFGVPIETILVNEQ